MKLFSDEKILSDIKGHYQLQAHGFQHALDAGIEAITKVQKYEKTIKDIKAEIKNMEYLACPQPEVVISDVLKIIDKHLADMRGET